MDKTEIARHLRSQTTDAVRLLWRHLRNRNLHGYKFRRQVPVGQYIADFACLDRMLIIEVDGGQHLEQSQHDAKRTRFIEHLGFRVIRFWNNELLLQTDRVLESILDSLTSDTPSPQPSPSRERGNES